MDAILKATEENIKVIVRIKPNNEIKGRTFLTHHNDSIVVPDKAEYAFDKVAGGDVSQEDIFDSCKSLFQSFVDGYNATIFAYGQTGSGKTFTMTGDSDETGISQNPGLIPRGLEYIFDKVKERALSKNVEYLIKCSFVEIYNEQIYDLLDPAQQKLNLRFNISQEVFLEQCTEIIMENPIVANEILKRGLSNRHSASTLMNRESSRSHAVFSIVLESRESQGEIFNINKSCLHLVDLAGSERQKDTKTDGIRLKEAGMINKSLLALSMVIRKLVESAKSNKPAYIAYRDSKLTLLLKDAIGGNSKTSLVACVHNDMRYMAETWSTLQFASSVKMIKNKAKINIDTQGDNESLRNEIRVLRDQLESNKAPLTIQDHEFDFDLVWKKRFITAMALRSCMSIELRSLNEQMTTQTTSNLRLQNSVDDLKTDIEIKNKKLVQLKERQRGEIIEDGDLAQLLATTVTKLNAQVQDTSERVKCDQLEIQITHLKAKLDETRILNNFAVSDQSLTHSLLKDYNSIVESGDFEKTMAKLDGKNVEMINIQQELSQSRFKYSLMKKKMHSTNITHRDERRKLEAEVASMRSNLKVVDEQREAAVVDRRKTLLSVHDIRPQLFSPIKNVIGINSRRGTQRKMRQSTLIEENEENEFEPMTDWIKNNDENASKLDKIGVLEESLRTKETKIGKMEYDLKEYKNEIEELRNALFIKETLQKNLTDMKEKYNLLNMSLQESHETVKKVQKEYSSLESTKDKTIKLLNEKTFVLEEEMKTAEMDRDMYKDELEREKLTKDILTVEVERMDQLVSKVEKDNSQKDIIIQSLNSTISDNISVFEELARTKYELTKLQEEWALLTTLADQKSALNSTLQKKIEECKAEEQMWASEISSLLEKIEGLVRENDILSKANEETNESASRLQREVEDLDAAHCAKILELTTSHSTKQHETKSKLEESDAHLLSLTDEVDNLKSEVERLCNDNTSLRSKISCTSPSPLSRLMIASPSKTSSPLAKQFTKDSDSRSSLLDDLVTSNILMEQKLRQEKECSEQLKTIIDELLIYLQLPTSHSTVGDMEAVRSKLIGYKLDYEDLVIKMMDTDQSFKEMNNLHDRNMKIALDKQDLYKTQYEELIQMLPNAGHLNSKQRINFFTKYKEENMVLRSENMELLQKIKKFTEWLIQKKLYDSYNSK